MFEVFKWISNICYIVGTMLLLSPILASKAITPWVLFIVGNMVLFVLYVQQRSIPLITLSIFFFCWDIITIISRLTGFEYFSIIMPLIHKMENIIP